LHTMLRAAEFAPAADRPESPPWRAAPVLVPRNGIRVVFRPTGSPQPIGTVGR